MIKEGEMKEKKQWETPELVELGVDKTKSGGGGSLSDVSNTTSATNSLS